MDTQTAGFVFGIVFFLIIEAINCMFPYYGENVWTEKYNGEYYENIGCFCQWTKDKFEFNEEDSTWVLKDEQENIKAD